MRKPSIEANSKTYEVLTVLVSLFIDVEMVSGLDIRLLVRTV